MHHPTVLDILLASRGFDMSDYRLLIGTYTRTEPDASKGIYHATFDDATGQFNVHDLAAEAVSPAFLAQSGEYIYAVNETRDGMVSAYHLQENELVFINTVSTGGALPCHLAATLDWIAVANYSSGNLATFALRDGALGERIDFVQHTGEGPNQQRQTQAHAHQTYLIDNSIFVPDLGSDKLYRYQLDTGGKFVGEPRVADLNPGAGPRHVDHHPWLPIVYLINELGNTINILDTDTLTVQQTIPTLPDDYDEVSTTSEIAVSADGKFVYGSNRGHDSIVSFAVDDSGQLSQPQYTSTDGQCPRHFTLDPSGKWLLVANQNTNNVKVFALNNGRPTYIVSDSSVPRPVCIHFLDSN